MRHGCNCKKLAHCTVHNKRFRKKPAAVEETALRKCNAIFNRCERKLKNSMLLGSVLYSRIISYLTSTVTKFFKRCTSFHIIEFPP